MTRRSICTISLLAVVVACGGSKKVGAPIEWPPPPSKARIRFVAAFSHTHDLDTSGWSGFKRSAFGGSADPSLGQPMGLAISDDGNRLYIADFGLSKVLVADFPGKRLKLFAPDEDVGQPFDVAIDGEENVYVTDTAGARVLVLDRAGRWRGVIVDKRHLERPTGIAIDRERGLLYVADSASGTSTNHRVRVFDLHGKHLRDLGVADASGSTMGEEEGKFRFPLYLAIDSKGQVIVGDSMNYRLQVFDAEGNFVRSFGEAGDGPGTFSRIKGLAIDSFDNLYVADAGHELIQIINSKFQILTDFAGGQRMIEFATGPRPITVHRPSNRIFLGNIYTARINVYDLINTKAGDQFANEDKAAPAAAADADASAEPAGE